MGIWRGLAVAGVVVGLGGVAVGRVEAQRLPGGVRPEHYSLTITPDLKAATFVGSETIDVVLVAPATAITLNAAEIEFVSVKAMVGGQPMTKTNTGVLRSAQDDDSSSDAQAALVTLDRAKEQATFTFAQALPAGRVRLAIEYKGILNDKLRGFYLSKTKLRRYGVTQFEATDARRAFPSFDEPSLKASFDVTLVVDAGDTAFSNMKIVSDTTVPIAGKHTVVFAQTPRMSTYLVAWLVGDFKCSEGKSDGVPIRVCATPDKVGLTRFALSEAKQALRDYNEYFGIKYPLAKLDLVAVPDFEAGAMENFGCITFREAVLLVNKRDGALPAKKEVAETVAHEMAHLWLGDLVTPAWWDNLWLNEGFATWMETKEAAKEHPKWRFEQDAAVGKNRTMDEDAGRSTRAVRAQAETPAEINEMFDDIAYNKAGAVIAMVENWVGEETFRKGLQAYVAAHEYGNATAEDFWNAQARVSGLPVDAVMRSFVEQPGVPVVTLSSEGASDPVTQRRFFLSGAANGTSGVGVAGQAWTIPVCIKSATCQLLTPQTLELQEGPARQFFYANAGDMGYYRTAYAPEQLKTIVAHAETALTPPERIGLLGDEWALMRAGQGPAGDFMDLVLAVKHDPNATVMESALGRVTTIESRIATDEDRERMDKVVRREFGGVYAGLDKGGWFEAEEREELRQTLFAALGRAGDPAVLTEAMSETQALLGGQKPTDAAVTDAAVALTVAKGDAAMYEKMLRLAQSATDPDLKQDALRTLTRFQAPDLVTRTLEYAMSDQVRSQDSWTLIAQLLSRRETQDAAWAFVQQHWGEIAQRETENSGTRIVEATGAFCTVERRDEVTSFFAAHPVASARRTLARSIESIDDCIHLRAAQEPELRRWLDAHTTQ
jgi:aminopeptidase N/puromycin-sensitive aminopeptidase